MAHLADGQVFPRIRRCPPIVGAEGSPANPTITGQLVAQAWTIHAARCINGGQHAYDRRRGSAVPVGGQGDAQNRTLLGPVTNGWVLPTCPSMRWSVAARMEVSLHWCSRAWDEWDRTRHQLAERHRLRTVLSVQQRRCRRGCQEGDAKDWSHGLHRVNPPG